jgi:hypothetical protein
MSPTLSATLHHVVELAELAAHHSPSAGESVACYARSAAWWLEHDGAGLDPRHPERMLRAVRTNLALYSVDVDEPGV